MDNHPSNNITSDPETTPYPPGIFDLSIAKVTGLIPTENLNIGTTSGQVAAGNDPRLSNGVHSVASVAELRSLPVPILGTDAVEVLTRSYYANLSGGGNRYRWSATTAGPDNGGTVIRPSALNAPSDGQQGRWLAPSYGSMELDCAQFGAVPGAPSAQTRAAIQAANDALPLYSGAGTNYVTPSGRYMRQGVLKLPSGIIQCDSKIFFSGGVRVEGAGMLKTDLAFDYANYSSQPQPYYLVDFELGVGVLPGTCFGTGLSGMSIDCGASPGSSGVYILADHGVRVDDLHVANFLVEGLYFGGQEIGMLWITGYVDGNNGFVSVGPGLTICNNTLAGQTLVRSAHIEHLAGRDAQGNVVPYLLVTNSPSVVMLSLEGESNDGNAGVFCQIRDSKNVTVINADVNYFNGESNGHQGTVFLLSGDTGNVNISNVQTYRGAILLVDDRSSTEGNRPAGYRRTVPGGDMTSYYQSMVTTDLTADKLTAGSVATNALTVAGHFVPQELLTTGWLAGHKRLRLKLNAFFEYAYTWSNWLVHVTHYSGKDFTFLVSAIKPYQGDVHLVTTLLRGDGLTVSTTGALAPTGAVDPSYVLHCETTFSTSEANLAVYSATVTALGTSTSSGGDGASSVQWLCESETNETPTPNVFGPAVPNSSGKTAINKLTTTNLFSAASPVTGSATLNNTDPDIEVDATNSGAFSLQLHGASGNVGLLRTISNVGTTNNVTLYTQSPDVFSGGATTYILAPGKSVRLKVNLAGNKFLVV